MELPALPPLAKVDVVVAPKAGGGFVWPKLLVLKAGAAVVGVAFALTMEFAPLNSPDGGEVAAKPVGWLADMFAPNAGVSAAFGVPNVLVALTKDGGLPIVSKLGAVVEAANPIELVDAAPKRFG